MKTKKKIFWQSIALGLTLSIGMYILPAIPAEAAAKKPLTIAEQGSFTVGGTYKQRPGTFSQENFIAEDGQRAYGDFAYVSVYLVDQPRSGEANLSTEAVTPDTPWASNPMYGDKTLYVLSRIGHYDAAGNPVPNAQFPEGEKNYQAFQQSWTIGSGPLDNELNAGVLAELVDQQKDGAVLVTHSMGGTIGWRTAIRSDKVKGIIAYEPGGTPFIFPETEMPMISDARFKALSASAKGVPMKDFLKLTKMPIVLYYGDYIKIGSENVGEDKWGTEFAMARQFVDTVNRHGGDATLIHLPEIGIKGNSHFLMQEKNNAEIMKLALDWLKKKGLDK